MRVFTALLDTNVLWPSLLRDFLLSLAVEGLYRPVWSEAILEELRDCEVTKLTRRGVEPSEARARAVRLIEQMRTHFDDAVVTGWEGLDGPASRSRIAAGWQPSSLVRPDHPQNASFG
jgi:hypothetical protein